MSDIASKAQLGQASSQLPVSWYFDEKVFELETENKTLKLQLQAKYAGEVDDN